ncbi:GntR family transcriptional regulator [Corynebacterium aquilae]|uniref:HTH gntR-type domain-containing protein n=1 Tax=Corynebacterium aquilae DSM 44791 TaxID=1431546 RepID=A0A1L7CIB8_9CORY|nr:GntR family transcriptional regulator [Corynebacterium aquilae]APT85555.1 hypothetical protein CAQU_11420 [Corynebacterium aquilae DSM 44791]
MPIIVDPFSTTPIFTQLHDSIVKAIASGELAPGTKLNSVRMVAAEFGINPATVKKAYDLLQEEGVVVTHPREGTVVARPTRATAVQRKAIAAQVETALALGKAQGMTPAQLASACSSVLASFSAS